MAPPRIVIVGAGPAGMRAAETLVAAGLRPVVIDEAGASGGQIYRRQPGNFRRTYRKLYGFDETKAAALHQSFDGLRDRIDFHSSTLAWNVRDGMVHLVRDGEASAVEFDALILATGATDRIAPVKGWTLPGCYTLGGSQIAMKAMACAIGERPVFMGTGPLLYLVASQYVAAGVKVRAVLDTSSFLNQVKALPDLAVRPSFVGRGLYFRARLMAAGVDVRTGIRPVAIEGDAEVKGVTYRSAKGELKTIACDAVGMGYHLRSETQLADLAGCPLLFDELTGQWRLESDDQGRTPRPGVYVAGDGAAILGADAAECAGRLAALAVLADHGYPVDAGAIERLLKERQRYERFRRGLLTAFPWPDDLVRSLEDDVTICRCEVISAGDIREVATGKGAPEMNRAKALSRVGMGRCQGRYCGSAAAEIVAAARGTALESVGRLRGQAPVKPLPLATVRRPQP